jgi:hypothetical protein
MICAVEESCIGVVANILRRAVFLIGLGRRAGNGVMGRMCVKRS